VKNKYEKREYLITFFFEKKVIRFAKKMKIMLEHFLIGFGLVTIPNQNQNIFKKCLDRSLEHAII
jgi:hypothetical protein